MPSWLSSLLNWAISGSSAWTYIICLAIGFGGGWYVTSDHYQKEILEIQTEAATTAANMEKDNARRLAEAVAARDVALDRVADISDSNTDLLVRIRMLEQASRGGTGKAAGSGVSGGEELARCRGLLSRGAEILDRGCREYGRCAADKDALATLVK